MPTYDYRCGACGHEFEEFQSITAGALRKCPECKKLKLKRLIGGGAGILFKGSGFYETDYRSESYKKAQAGDQKAPADDQKAPAGGSSSEGKDASDKKSATTEPKTIPKPSGEGNKSKED